MVEQEAVNFEVASSSLARGAILGNKKDRKVYFYFLISFLEPDANVVRLHQEPSKIEMLGIYIFEATPVQKSVEDGRCLAQKSLYSTIFLIIELCETKKINNSPYSRGYLSGR